MGLKPFLEKIRKIRALIEDITHDVISRIHEDEEETVIAGKLEQG